MIRLLLRSIQLNTILYSIYLILVSLQVIPRSHQQHLLQFLISLPSLLGQLMERKSTSVRRATVALLPVATLLDIFAFTQVNAITSVLFLGAKHVVLGKTTYSNITAFISLLAHDGAQAPQRVLRLPVPWASAVLAQKIAELHPH
jgi:hypothetical protein